MSCLVVFETDYKLQYSQGGSGSVYRYFVTDPDHTGAFDTYQDPEKQKGSGSCQMIHITISVVFRSSFFDEHV